MKFFNLSIVIMLVVVVSGCSEQQFSKSALMASVDQNRPLSYSRAQCEVPTSNYELSTNVISYELVDKFHVSFGFDLIKKFFRAFGANIELESGQMAMQMDLGDSLNPSTPLANALGGAKMRKFSFGASVDLVQAAASFDYYYKTPLSELTRNSLRNTLQVVNQQLSKTQGVWSTTVVARASDQDMIIPVGTVAGLQAGDQFNIYNVQHVWTGSPCESQYIMSRKTTANAVAVGLVVDLRPGAADLQIISGDGSLIEQGARVEPLVLQNSHGLARSIHIASVTSGKLDVDGKSEIDVVTYLKSEINSVVREFGFYIKN